MSVICPLCGEEVDIYHRRRAIHISHHTAPVFKKDKLNKAVYRIPCPVSGEALLSLEED